jgi:hypothetical protein
MPVSTPGLLKEATNGGKELRHMHVCFQAQDRAAWAVLAKQQSIVVVATVAKVMPGNTR